MSDEQVKIPEDLRSELVGRIGRFIITGGRHLRYNNADQEALIEIFTPFIERITRTEQALAALEAIHRGHVEGTLCEQIEQQLTASQQRVSELEGMCNAREMKLESAQQQVAALVARNKEADSYLKRYEERPMWGTDGDDDVKLARAALKGAS